MWIFKFLCIYFMTELVNTRPLPLGFLNDYTIHEAFAATRTENDQQKKPSPPPLGMAPKHPVNPSDLQASDATLKSSTYSTLYTFYTSEITKPNLYSNEFTPNKLSGIPDYIKDNMNMPMTDTIEDNLDYATFDTAQLEDLLNMIKKKAVDKRNYLKRSRINDDSAHRIKRRKSDEQKPSLACNLKNMYKKVFQKVSTDFQNELNYTISSFKEVTGLYDTTTSKNGPSVAEKVTEAPSEHKTTTLATTAHTVTSDGSDMDNNENTDGQEKNDSTESFTSTTSESTTAPSSNDDKSSNAQEKIEESHDTTKITTSLTTQQQNATKQIKKDSTRPKKQALDFNKLMLDNLTNSVTSRSDDIFNVLNLFENEMHKTQNINKMSIYPKRKRNSEMLSDVKFNVNVFNEGDIMPEAPYDFSEDTLEPEPVTGSQSDMRLDYENEERGIPEVLSLSTLSNKIAYSDYINGYKYYLNYQRELGKDHFSDLVKYQAHKHHKVDDIGKFILEKLPHVPEVSRKKRQNVEVYTPDSQDAFTKNDGSWFKKHFYLFIDSGSPKKFHSSQTVPMKTLETTPNAPKNDMLQGNKNHKYRSNYANSLFGSDVEAKDTPEVLIESTTHPKSSFAEFIHKIIDIREDCTTKNAILFNEMSTEDVGKPKDKRETGKKIKRVPLFGGFNFRQKHWNPRLSKLKRQVTQRNTRFIFKKWKNMLKDKVPNGPTVVKGQGKSPSQNDKNSQFDMKFNSIKPEQYKVPNIDDLRVEVPNITFDNTFSFQQKAFKKFPSSTTYSSQINHQSNSDYQDYTSKAKEPKGVFKVADPFTPEPFKPEPTKNDPYKMPYSYKTQDLDMPQTLNETMNEMPFETTSESYGKPLTTAGDSYGNVYAAKISPKTLSTTTESWLPKSDTTSKGPQTQLPVRLDFEFTPKSRTQNIEPRPWSITRINLHRTIFPTTGILNLLSGPQSSLPMRLDFELTSKSAIKTDEPEPWSLTRINMQRTKIPATGYLNLFAGPQTLLPMRLEFELTSKSAIKTDEPEPWSLTRINMQRTKVPATGYLNLFAAPVSSSTGYSTKGLIFYDKVPAYEDMDVITDSLEAIAWDGTRYVSVQKEPQPKKSKQFFTTPIPMKINEFDKYKVNEIDNASNLDSKSALSEVQKFKNYQQLWANPTKIIKPNKMNTQNSVQKYRENTFEDDDEVTEVLVNVNTYDENDLSKDFSNTDQIDIDKYKNILNGNRLDENTISQRTDTLYTKEDNDVIDVIDFGNSSPSETYQTKHNNEHSGNIDWSSLSHQSNASKNIAQNLRDMLKAVEAIQKAHMFKDASLPNIITEKSHPDIIIAETPKPSKLKEKVLNESLYERKKYPQVTYKQHSKINVAKDMKINLPNLEAKPSSEKPRKVQISNHVYKFDIIYSNPQPEGQSETDSKAAKAARRYFLEKPNNLIENPSYNIEQKDLSTIATIKYTPVYINLPTYYEPNTQLPDVEIVVTRKEVWHDHIMRCLSGLALVELLRKYGFNKIIDGDNSTENGIINSNKVYRDRVVKRTAALLDREQMRGRRFDGETLKFWKKKKTIKSTTRSNGNNLHTTKTVTKAADKKVRRSTKSLMDMLQSPFTKKTTKQENPLDDTMVGKMIKEMEKARKVNTLDQIEKQFKSKHGNALSPYRPATHTLLGTMGKMPNILKNKISCSEKAKKNVKRNVSVTQFTVKDVAQLDIVMDMEKKMVDVNDGKEKRDIQLVINSVSGSKKAKKQRDNVADERTTAKMYGDPSDKHLESKGFKIKKVFSPSDALNQVSISTKKSYANNNDRKFNTVSLAEVSDGLYFIIQRGEKIILNPLLQSNVVMQTSPMPFTKVETVPGFVLSPRFVASMEEKLSKIYNVLLDNGASQKLNETFRKKRNYNNKTHCSNRTSKLIKTDDLQRGSRRNDNIYVIRTVGSTNLMKTATSNIYEKNGKTYIEDEYSIVLPSKRQATSAVLTANNTNDDSKIAENVNNVIQQLQGVTANMQQNTIQISKSIIEFGHELEKDFKLTDPPKTTKPTKTTSVKVIEEPKIQQATTAPPKTTSVKIIPPTTEKSITGARDDDYSEPNTQKATTDSTLVIVSDFENEHLEITMTKPTTVNVNDNLMENNKYTDIRPDFLQVLANNLTEKNITLSETQPGIVNLKVSKKFTKKTSTGVTKKIVAKQKSKEKKKITPKLSTKALTKLEKKTKKAHSKT